MENGPYLLIVSKQSLDKSLSAKRKQNYRSAFMRNQKWKHPNAHKHGIFAATAILPGEDRREFEELHSAVIGEWVPAGATEEEAVLSIAKGVWRKRRVQKFLEVQLMKNILDPSHPSYDETLGLLGFAARMKLKPETAFEEYASRCLRADKINHLKQKFPRADFKSTLEWAQAIINEIDSLRAEASIPLREMADLVALCQSSATLSNDLFKQELALDERLDAMIDRAVKRLIQTKAMKQMLGQTFADQAANQPKKILPRRTSNG